ncbi:hypothetical protein [Pseudomonas chlororaphis]|uniref:hypothetical protein n=1 Tax=Pseudomonas chlororaphis TaxID=587753 RepID=UPI0024079E8B|nr:hypothetical protein [Pseudomonas chlororaphis]
MQGIYKHLLNLTIAVIVSLTLSAYSGLLDKGWLSVLLNVVTTVAAMYGLQYMLNYKDARYSKRISDPSAPELDVRLNGIKIGTLSDADYAAMQQEALRDGRNALAQLFNVGRVAFTVIDRLIVVVPVLAFWGALAFAVFSPYSPADMLLEFQKTDVATVTHALKQVLQICVTLSLVAMFVMPVFGFRFGFKNCYSAAVDQMLRHHFNTPADGDFRVTRPLNATLHKDNKPC